VRHHGARLLRCVAGCGAILNDPPAGRPSSPLVRSLNSTRLTKHNLHTPTARHRHDGPTSAKTSAPRCVREQCLVLLAHHRVKPASSNKLLRCQATGGQHRALDVFVFDDRDEPSRTKPTTTTIKLRNTTKSDSSACVRVRVCVCVWLFIMNVAKTRMNGGAVTARLTFDWFAGGPPTSQNKSRARGGEIYKFSQFGAELASRSFEASRLAPAARRRLRLIVSGGSSSKHPAPSWLARSPVDASRTSLGPLRPHCKCVCASPFCAASDHGASSHLRPRLDVDTSTLTRRKRKSINASEWLRMFLFGQARSWASASVWLVVRVDAGGRSVRLDQDG
jgi:hypothetical protein